MKIRTKLLIALGALPIMLISLIGMGWFQHQSLNQTSVGLEEELDLVILSEQIHRDIKDTGIRLRNIVVYDNEQNISMEIEKIDEEFASITKSMATLDSKISTDEQRYLYSNLDNVLNDFNDYGNEVVNLVVSGMKEEAILLIQENSNTLQEDFYTILSDFTGSFEQNMHRSLTNFSNDLEQQNIISAVILSLIVLLIFGLLLRNVWTISTRLNKVSNVMKNIASGNKELGGKVEVDANDEIGEVVHAFNQMASSLEEQMNIQQEQTWIKTNIADITTSISETQELHTLSQMFLSKIVPLVEASHAVFYVKDMDEHSEPVYKLQGSYAFKERKHHTNIFREGEGLIGQAVLEKEPIILTDVPNDYIRIKSGLGEAAPFYVYVLPIIFEGDVKAVLEIASFHRFTESQQEFLEELMSDLGIILESVMGRIQLAKLLEESQALTEETQAQAEELQTQQDELKAANEELEEQTQALRDSEEKLQTQQEELEQINADLEEKTKVLEDQNKRFEQKNKEVEAARAELEEKAKQLAQSSKYKSEFLANMSHELRTPLNSLLILSKLLADNTEGNLSDKQVEFSKTIYSSGNDLLSLINDILDLAKIESGKMEVHPSQVVIAEIEEFIESNFRPLAMEKKLDFYIEKSPDVPRHLYTDEIKVQQVLKNLLSNAIKFTEKGSVSLEIDVLPETKQLSFTVKDTGIGIAADKQELIFEAFQQADGTTSRKFGGTGLGLSICREAATLLGGEVRVESIEGKGSTFTFIVGDYEEEIMGESTSVKNTVQQETAATIERVESDIDLPVEKQEGAELGETEQDDPTQIKRLLIVDDDQTQRNSLMELIGDMDIVIKAVSTGYEAIEELKVSKFDCMVLDLGLTDTSGFDLLEKIKEDDTTNTVKVFVYTGRDLTSKEELQLNKYAHTIIIKDEHAPTRLKEELKLYLNESNQKTLANNQQGKMQENQFNRLVGNKILLVDDDVRNVYALSNVLEQYGMEIIFAENGAEGLELLHKNPDANLVLMDIMMPEMDGYEAITRIRQLSKFRDLPIIALTAKAMKEDREKCMEVGATDYIVKPIDPDQLISLIRVWLYQ